MLWIDGQLIGQKFAPNGTQWVEQNPRTRVTVNRSITAIEPGPAVPVTFSLWEHADNNGRYLDTTVVVPGTPAPFVLPTVPSSLTVRPKILRTLFNCERQTVLEDNLLPQLTAANINALSFQVFNSPGDNAGWDTLQKWQTAFEQLVGVQIDYCVANGLAVHGMADGFLRNAAERNWLANTPWAPAAVQYVATRLRDSGVCWGVCVIDEAWYDASVYEPALSVFLTAWHSVAGAPPIAFPQPATDSNHGDWERAGYADYASRYATNLQWRAWKKTQHSTWENFDSTKYQTQEIPAGWQWLCGNAGIVGPFYQKKIAGGDYQPGDELIDNGARPANVTTQLFLALAYGCSGFRVYGYDWSLWRNQRLNAVPGEVLLDGLQTGGKPGDDRWAAMSAAFSWIAAHEVELTTGTLYQPVTSGPWVFGRRGSLVFSINTVERALPSPSGPGVVPGGGFEALSV